LAKIFRINHLFRNFVASKGRKETKRGKNGSLKYFMCKWLNIEALSIFQQLAQVFSSSYHGIHEEAVKCERQSPYLVLHLSSHYKQANKPLNGFKSRLPLLAHFIT